MVRKMAIDVIYTMAAILKDSLRPFKSEILDILNHQRADKIKPVREASLEAIQAVKDIPDDETTSNITSYQQHNENRNSHEESLRLEG